MSCRWNDTIKTKSLRKEHKTSTHCQSRRKTKYSPRLREILSHCSVKASPISQNLVTTNNNKFRVSMTKFVIGVVILKSIIYFVA
jgi:hypothetical protein